MVLLISAFTKSLYKTKVLASILHNFCICGNIVHDVNLLNHILNSSVNKTDNGINLTATCSNTGPNSTVGDTDHQDQVETLKTVKISPHSLMKQCCGVCA